MISGYISDLIEIDKWPEFRRVKPVFFLIILSVRQRSKLLYDYILEIPGSCTLETGRIGFFQVADPEFQAQPVQGPGNSIGVKPEIKTAPVSFADSP